MDTFSAPAALQMIEESDFEAVISQYEEEIQDLRRKVSAQNSRRVPPCDDSLAATLATVLEKYRDGDVEQAGNEWRETQFRPFPGEDWEFTYNSLRKVAICREEVLQAKLNTAKATIAELKRNAAAKTKAVSEVRAENDMLRTLSTRKTNSGSTDALAFKSQINSLSGSLSAQDAEIRELNSELDLAHSENERLSILLSELRAQPRDCSSPPHSEDVLRLLREVQELKDEKKAMKKQLDDCQRLTNIIKRQEKTIEELESRSGSKSDLDIKSIQKHVQLMEEQHLEELESLRGLLTAEKQLREAAESRCISYTSETKDLKSLLEALQTDLKTSESIISDLKETSKGLIATNSELESRVILAENRLGRWENQSKQAESSQSSLEVAYSDAKLTARSLEQTNQRLMESQGELRDEIDRLHREKREKDEEIAAKESQLEANCRQIEEYTREIHRLSLAVDSKPMEVQSDDQELRAALDENEKLYRRLQEAEGKREKLDEVSTELEIVQSEYSELLEKNRSLSLDSQHQTLLFAQKSKQMTEEIANLTSECAISTANLRLKEEEIVDLTERVEKYKRQVQDCRDMLRSELPHSRTAKAYAEGLAQDWDLIGKIEAQIEEIERISEENRALKARLQGKEAEVAELTEVEKEIQAENAALREENKVAVGKAAVSEEQYKARLEEFQKSLSEQQDSLRRSYEDLGRKSQQFQKEIHRYAQQREKDLQDALEREREMQQSSLRDSQEGASLAAKYTEEIRRLQESTRQSIRSVSELANSIGEMFEDWFKALPKAISPLVTTRKLESRSDFTQDLANIKSFVSSLLGDFSSATETRRSATPLDYESTLDFAQRLLQKFDMEGGHVEEALVVQLIKEKIGLERELLKKSEQLLRDEQFFRKVDSGKEDDSRQSWATARWQESETETYRLRTLFMESSKRIEDFFAEKGLAAPDNETISELRAELKSLRKENQAKDATIKALGTEKSAGEMSKPMLAQKAAYEGLIADMKTQQTQAKATWESKEKAWKDAMKTLLGELQVEESAVGKVDFAGNPTSFVTALVGAVGKAKKKSEDTASEQNRQFAQYKAEIDSWTVKEESWTSERLSLQKTVERAHSETDRLKAELATTKEMVEKLMSDMRDLTRRSEREIPEEHFKRGVIEGKLQCKQAQKRLKRLVADYRDQLEAMKVKYEGLQDQVVALTTHSNQLMLEKESMHEEMRSRFESKSRSRIFDRQRSNISRQISAIRPEDPDFDFELSKAQGSPQLSTSRDILIARPKPQILVEKEEIDDSPNRE